MQKYIRTVIKNQKGYWQVILAVVVATVLTLGLIIPMVENSVATSSEDAATNYLTNRGYFVFGAGLDPEVDSIYIGYRHLTDNGSQLRIDNYAIPRTATFVVAASNASAQVKAQADYVCDGTADNVEIQAAIDASTISLIQLSEGNFNISSTLKPNSTANSIVRIVGAGSGYHSSGYASELYLADDSNCNMWENVDDVSYRTLELRNLVMDGNKANNTSGHCILLNQHLEMGGHLAGGIYNCHIRSFKNSGIYGNPGSQVLYLGAQYLIISGCDDYGIYVNGCEGAHLKMPIWLNGNGEAGIWGVFTNSEVEVGTENSGTYGAYLHIANTPTLIHTLNNNYHGARFTNIAGSMVTIVGRGNGQDWTDCSEAADYQAQVFLAGISDSIINISLDQDNTPVNTDGVSFKNGTRCLINLSVDSNRYALKLPNLGEKTGCLIQGTLNGDTSDVDYLSQYWYLFNTGGNKINVPSFAESGNIVTISKIIDHASLTDNGDATAYMDFDDSIPAGSVIQAVKVDYTQAFNSDDTSTLTMQIGSTGDPDAYNLTASGEDAFNTTTDVYWGQSDCQAHRVNAETTPRVLFTEDDDGTDIISSANAQGTVTITITYMKT